MNAKFYILVLCLFVLGGTAKVKICNFHFFLHIKNKNVDRYPHFHEKMPEFHPIILFNSYSFQFISFVNNKTHNVNHIGRVVFIVYWKVGHVQYFNEGCSKGFSNVDSYLYSCDCPLKDPNIC